MSVQTQNPSFDVAFWNQPRNLFPLGVDALFPAVNQGLIELPPPILNRMSVSIDYYDQCGFGVTDTVDIHFLCKRFPHPSLGVYLARGRTLDPHLMFSQPALGEKSIDQHFVMGVFQNHDYGDSR